MDRIVELSLYIPDRLEESQEVLFDLQVLCDRYLPKRYRISVMDQSSAASGRRIVSVPFVTTDLGGKGKNTYNLDGTETPALIEALEAEAAKATLMPGMKHL